MPVPPLVGQMPLIVRSQVQRLLSRSTPAVVENLSVIEERLDTILQAAADRVLRARKSYKLIYESPRPFLAVFYPPSRVNNLFNELDIALEDLEVDMSATSRFGAMRKALEAEA